MGNVYYAGVAPNKEAAICGGLTEAIVKCIQNAGNHPKVSEESFIGSIKIVLNQALNKFDENNASDTICVVETLCCIQYDCEVELIYVNEPMFKHYYIRFELFQ